MMSSFKVAKVERRRPEFTDTKRWIDRNLAPETNAYDDQRVYENVYHSGKFVGVFQCTSSGAQELFMSAKPRSIIDIACLTSIYRPGPLAANVDKLWLKHEKEPFDWGHPLINETLKDSRGLLVFQESVMALAHKVGGFPLAETDEVRRAIMKRSISGGEAAKQKAKELEDTFVQGAIKNGVPEEIAQKAYQTILWMSGYGFNRTLIHTSPIDVYKNSVFVETKQIKDLTPSDSIPSRDEHSGELTFVNVIQLHDHGVQELVEVELVTGEKTQCTWDHKFRVKETGQMMPLSEIYDRGLSIVTFDERPFYPYVCQKCCKTIKRKGSLPAYTHEQHYIDCLSKFTEGVEYIECKLCKYAARMLSKHVKSIHKMSVDEYTSLYGKVTCDELHDSRSELMKVSGDWINRKKQAGEDLTAYKLKMGKVVSDSVVSNPDERARRSALLSELNKREDSRERSRVAAIETSKRPDILAARTVNLKNWRDNNYEEFYEKCVKCMITTFHSKPELALYAILKLVDDYNFKFSQVIKHSMFHNKTKSKQIDVADKVRNVYVEFDGPCHFNNLHSNDIQFKETQLRDASLEKVIMISDWTLIRISYDQWSYTSGGSFSKSCLSQLFEILACPKPGVFKIGAAYNTADTQGTHELACSDV